MKRVVIPKTETKYICVLTQNKVDEFIESLHPSETLTHIGFHLFDKIETKAPLAADEIDFDKIDITKYIFGIEYQFGKRFLVHCSYSESQYFISPIDELSSTHHSGHSGHSGFNLSGLLNCIQNDSSTLYATTSKSKYLKWMQEGKYLTV